MREVYLSVCVKFQIIWKVLSETSPCHHETYPAVRTPPYNDHWLDLLWRHDYHPWLLLTRIALLWLSRIALLLLSGIALLLLTRITCQGIGYISVAWGQKDQYVIYERCSFR